MLQPVLVLILWTLIIWVWMYATRIPAIQAAKIDPNTNIHPGALDKLPASVRVVADNYNHLHEQPTIFYALAFCAHLAGVTDTITIAVAWGYVGLRILHSFVQIILKNVIVRFSIFTLSTIGLFVLAGRIAFSLF